MLLTWITALLLATLAPQASTTDQGMIAYFEEPCPYGWTTYHNLTGRVPIGAGKYIGKAEDGRTEAVVYQPSEIGGEIKHNQTTQEMPKHDHNRNADGMQEIAIVRKPGTHSVTGGPFTAVDYIKTGTTGRGQPHNNIPPYLVLYPCKKVTRDNYAQQSKVEALEERIQALEEAASKR